MHSVFDLYLLWYMYAELSVEQKCLSVWLIVSICFYLPLFPIPHHPLSLSFPLTLSIHFSFTMNITTSIPEGPFQEITHYHPSLWHRCVGAFITTIWMRQQHMIAAAASGGLQLTRRTSYTDCQTSRCICQLRCSSHIQTRTLSTPISYRYYRSPLTHDFLLLLV